MRLVVFNVTTSVKHYVGLAVTSLIYFLCYRALSRLAGTASCPSSSDSAPVGWDRPCTTYTSKHAERLQADCTDCLAAADASSARVLRAAPSHGAGGELIDGGADLGQPGFIGYYFDAIYICIAVQLATLLSDWFWLLFLSVRPALLLVQDRKDVAGPDVSAPIACPVCAGPSIRLLQALWRSGEALAVCSACTTGAHSRLFPSNWQFVVQHVI